MSSQKKGLDLEKELTCSICTELLYQPLTLLDCLHTFCGACLKEWFSFQVATIEKAPTPPTPEAVLFTCPSCRASVRDTRHNATVVTLLDMFLVANPEKRRSQTEQEEMARKYTPGDQVLPKVKRRERTPAERRADQEDARLLQEVREMSAREASGELTVTPRTRRYRESRSTSGRSPREPSASSSGRHRRDRSHPPQSDENRLLGTDQGRLDEGRRRTRRSNSRERHVEHQSSLRSLISSEHMSERDIEREIEDFAQQIQEEGLLEGLDLDNIDLSRDDELSRRITEAYRRRQRDRARNEATRRTHATPHPGSSRPAEPDQSESRHLALLPSSRDASRASSSSRPGSSTGQADDRTRPPPSATNLEAPSSGRPRRRTASGGRSATTPLFSSPSEVQPAARSQTDLTLRSRALDTIGSRPSCRESRSSSTPSAPASASPTVRTETSPEVAGANESFANRKFRDSTAPSHPSRTAPQTSPAASTNAGETAEGPGELATNAQSITNSVGNPPNPSHQRVRSQLWPEPSITCSACGKTHIEYDVHYNCALCFGGQWNTCLNCYRTGQGCHYWFGFGYAAQELWERTRQKQSDPSLAPPHILGARRYLPPPSSPGGADGRRTLTTDDPNKRLQTGTFCAKCQAWSNQCYWRCGTCNDGDWGFCNNCVNQGLSCSHMLLPLAQVSSSLPGSPETQEVPSTRPASSTVLTDTEDSALGGFQTLMFRTRCDVCHEAIPPERIRYHCYECTSVLVPNSAPGDYDICSSCYGNLVVQGRISEENGFSGWRRCLEGHRMVVVGFAEGRHGRWRYVERDLVGGRVLRSEPADGPEPQAQAQRLLKWSWRAGTETSERLVTRDAADAVDKNDSGTPAAVKFPPDGGSGSRATAKWAWYPQADDEQDLWFPRGAEIAEVENINGDWMCGTYMGSDGTFPAPLVVMKED